MKKLNVNEVMERINKARLEKENCNFLLQHKRTEDFLVNTFTNNYNSVFLIRDNESVFFGIYGDFLKEVLGELGVTYDKSIVEQIDTRTEDESLIIKVLEYIEENYYFIDSKEVNEQDYGCSYDFKPIKEVINHNIYAKDIAEDIEYFISKKGNETVRYTIEGKTYTSPKESFENPSFAFKTEKEVIFW